MTASKLQSANLDFVALKLWSSLDVELLPDVRGAEAKTIVRTMVVFTQRKPAVFRPSPFSPLLGVGITPNTFLT